MSRRVLPSGALALVGCVLVLAACSADGPGRDPAAEVEPSGDRSRAPSLPELRYVALGDSFTAAPGVPDTDPQDGCLRSTGNYPAILATLLGVDHEVELTDVSCIGASTEELTGRQPVQDYFQPPQLDALDRGTDLVTLSMGGNDLGIYSRLVRGCLTAAQQDPDAPACRDSEELQGGDLVADAERVEERLVVAIEQIRRRAPRAQVLVVGYPQLAPARGSCPRRLPLAEGDQPFARTVNRTLTDSLARAAADTRTGYVDVWAASAGHDVCSRDPWVSGIEGVPFGPLPLHPLPESQSAIAELVLAAVDA